MKKITLYHLKIIAISFMIIDHVLKIFLSDIIVWLENNQLYSFSSYLILMLILSLGRIAFPIFAYMIANGCEHTHNIKKYISRLLLLAVISEVPFQYFVNTLNETSYSFSFTAGNVFFTLALGAISIEGYRYLKKKQLHLFISYLPVIICIILTQVLNTDYAGIGVLLTFLWYIFKNNKYWYLPGVFFSIFLYAIFYLTLGIINYGLSSVVIIEAIFYTCGSLFSILILKKYNDERGKPVKWFFYMFYPLHLLLIITLFNLIH